MMHLLDREPHYTWNDEWIHPYESLWGLLEKFKAANVLPTNSSISKMLNISCNPLIIPRFNDTTYTYYRSTDSKSYGLHPKMQYNMKTFENSSFIINSRIRYCPVCIKQGYHSVYHQLVFLDTCFLHKNIKLKYLCECEETYIIEPKKSSILPYQCKICNCRLPVPETADGILGLWNKQIDFSKQKTFINSKEISRIILIDYNHLLTKQTTVSLSSKQSEILKKYFYNKLSLSDSVYAKNKIELKSENLFFAGKYIHNKVIKMYGFEEYKRNYYHLFNTRYMRYETDGFNLKILASLFLIWDVSNVSYIDKIYPIDMKYGILEAKDSKYNSFLSFLSCIFPYYETSKYNSIINYVYKSYLKTAYSQICDMLKLPKDNNRFPVSGRALYYKEEFPTYLYIEGIQDNCYLFK